MPIPRKFRVQISISRKLITQETSGPKISQARKRILHSLRQMGLARENEAWSELGWTEPLVKHMKGDLRNPTSYLAK